MKSQLLEFGIGSLDVEKVLRTALRRGGALAELFFEESSATRIFYESGRVDRIIDGTDRGVGLRIIYDSRSVYGYTTDLSERVLLQLAETLSEAVQLKGNAQGERPTG